MKLKRIYHRRQRQTQQQQPLGKEPTCVVAGSRQDLPIIPFYWQHLFFLLVFIFIYRKMAFSSQSIVCAVWWGVFLLITGTLCSFPHSSQGEVLHVESSEAFSHFLPSSRLPFVCQQKMCRSLQKWGDVPQMLSLHLAWLPPLSPTHTYINIPVW